jgi:hypothetical protein
MRFIDEDWQPFDGAGDVLKRDVFDDAVAFHGVVGSIIIEEQRRCLYRIDKWEEERRPSVNRLGGVGPTGVLCTPALAGGAREDPRRAEADSKPTVRPIFHHSGYTDS